MSKAKSNRSWIDVLLALFGQLTPSQWKRLMGRLVLTVIVASVVCIIVLYVSTRFFGLKIKDGKLYLGVYEASLAGTIVVDATTGWQNSGIKLQKGQRVRLEPSGRIHLAANQLHNLAAVLKPIILEGSPERNWSEKMRERYPPTKFGETNVFYRDWIGPDGEDTPSDMLDGIKIRPDQKWGALLAVVLPSPVSDRSDPLRVLAESDIKLYEIIPVTGPVEVNATRDGWLTFIVNDAVVSPVSESEDSRDFYRALILMKQKLEHDARHQIREASIPLIWFSDNAGTFRVTVSQAE